MRSSSGTARSLEHQPIAGNAEPASAAMFAVPPRIMAGVFALALFVAWYVGFRMPNAWSATLQAASITDGFHRRFVVGTLLRPFALATNYTYWLFAAFSFATLAALVAVAGWAAVRSRSAVRQLLVIAFLLLPTGGFLFHDVGYFEQVLYLLLLAAAVLLQRKRLIAATAVMCVAPFVHEIAILTVLPIFGLIALRTLPFRRALVVTLVPAALDVIVLLVPAADADAIPTLSAALAHADFFFRHDALDLFTRTQSDNWQLYSIHEMSVIVKPVALFAMGAFACVWWAQRGLWTRISSTPPLAVLTASVAAVGIPGLLVYAGWDSSRWIFLVLVNLFVVVWLSFDEERAPRPGALAALVTTVLVVANISIAFIPPEQPRKLGYREVRSFLSDVTRGRATFMPGL